MFTSRPPEVEKKSIVSKNSMFKERGKGED
jgi:hypothetical protein